MSLKHLSLAAGRIEYLWHGPAVGTAPTLVFLHEGLGSARLWRDFPQRLAQATECSALVYSRFGYGGSAPCPLPRPLTYHTDEAVQVLPAILDRLGIGGYLAVGHSDGATISLLHAALAPAEGLLAVIAEAPHVFVEDETVTGIAATRDQYPLGLRDKLARHHGDNVDIAFDGWAETWLRPEFRDWNVEAMLPAIRVPVLVVQGRDDEYASLRQVEAIMRQTGGPAESVVVEHCGHVPHRDHTDTVLNAMADFVRRMVGQRGQR
jgi:pimeloyl-ACP methyl ester carboxylesterase